MNINKENIKPLFGNMRGRRMNKPSAIGVLTKRSYMQSTSSMFQTKSNGSESNKYLTPLKGFGSNMGPMSANTRTSSSNRSDESRILLALSEGRGQAVGVVGIACIDINKPNLILCQISDTQSYVKTLIKVNIINPKEIIIPVTFIEHVSKNRLLQILQCQFPNTKITTVARSMFNNTLGMQYVNHLCAAEYNSVSLIIKHKYYALAATAALLKYIEQASHIIYTSHSIKVEYQEPENTALIDIDTADRIELVSSTGDSNLNLLSVLNHCCTGIGKRLLRSTILQPSYSHDIVEARLDCVQEILDNHDFLRKIQIMLTKLSDIDYLLMFGIVMPQTANEVSERQLNYALRLKSIMNSIEPLTMELSITKHPVFRAIYQNLLKQPYKEISSMIATLLQDEAHPAKGQAGDIQRCFAIKNGINGLLDVARKTYTEIIDDMRAYVEELADKYNLPLRANSNCRKGFHILLILSKGMRNLKKHDLPSEFIQVDRQANSLSMTTQKMVEYGGRIKRALDEINSISNVMIYKLLLEIKPHISCLYKLCDDIALLDVLQSLSQASMQNNYVRPSFSEYIELKGSRHPLLDYTSEIETIGNPVFASEYNNFHIITGPNMSGKTIYIRQIILIQIMAQVGCFVPAQKVTLRLADRIFARIGMDDNFECNASSFVLEMKEMQYIFNSLTNKSIIIIDELCRSTSHDEGTSIAGAICEKLIKSKAFTFLATHFLYLATFNELYFNVSNWQMEVIEKMENSKSRLEYTYRLLPGVTSIQNYGIKLAKVCAISGFIIKRAEEILAEFLPLRKVFTTSEVSNNVDYLKYQLNAELKLLELKGELTTDIFEGKVQEFRKQTGADYDSTSIPAFNAVQLSNESLQFVDDDFFDGSKVPLTTQKKLQTDNVSLQFVSSNSSDLKNSTKMISKSTPENIIATTTSNAKDSTTIGNKTPFSLYPNEFVQATYSISTDPVKKLSPIINYSEDRVKETNTYNAKNSEEDIHINSKQFSFKKPDKNYSTQSPDLSFARNKNFVSYRKFEMSTIEISDLDSDVSVENLDPDRKILPHDISVTSLDELQFCDRLRCRNTSTPILTETVAPDYIKPVTFVNHEIEPIVLSDDDSEHTEKIEESQNGESEEKSKTADLNKILINISKLSVEHNRMLQNEEDNLSLVPNVVSSANSDTPKVCNIITNSSVDNPPKSATSKTINNSNDCNSMCSSAKSKRPKLDLSFLKDNQTDTPLQNKTIATIYESPKHQTTSEENITSDSENWKSTNSNHSKLNSPKNKSRKKSNLSIFDQIKQMSSKIDNSKLDNCYNQILNDKDNPKPSTSILNIKKCANIKSKPRADVDRVIDTLKRKRITENLAKGNVNILKKGAKRIQYVASVQRNENDEIIVKRKPNKSRKKR